MVVSVTLIFLLENKIGIMLIIILSALAVFQSSELSQFVHVWPIQEQNISLYNIVQELKLATFAPL